jgi:glycosyltransferase involved in cell wall biosynthesis
MTHKRVDMLLDVIAFLDADGRPVTCRIIGDGPEREALHEKARILGIAGAVEFRHDVTEQKDVYSLLKAAKIAVFPSSREGFGIAVLEALACGITVVTTSSPDNLAQHLAARSSRGVVCDPSVPSIAATIRGLLDGLPVPPSGPDESDSWLTDFSWEATVDQVASAFEL